MTNAGRRFFFFIDVFFFSPFESIGRGKRGQITTRDHFFPTKGKKKIHFLRGEEAAEWNIPGYDLKRKKNLGESGGSRQQVASWIFFSSSKQSVGFHFNCRLKEHLFSDQLRPTAELSRQNWVVDRPFYKHLTKWEITKNQVIVYSFSGGGG